MLLGFLERAMISRVKSLPLVLRVPAYALGYVAAMVIGPVILLGFFAFYMLPTIAVFVGAWQFESVDAVVNTGIGQVAGLALFIGNVAFAASRVTGDE